MRGAAPLCTPHVGAQLPQPPRAGAPPRAPGDFLVRRKSPKTHQEPPGSWTSGEGGLAPFDPPALCPSGIGCDSLNPQASSKPRRLPRHGLKTQSVPSMKPKEKTRPICPQTQSGKSVFFCGTSPFEGVAARCAAGGAKRPPRGSTQRGTPSGRFFGDFLIGEKVTRGMGRSAHTREERRGGCQPSSQGSYRQRKNFFSKTFSKVARLRATFPLLRGKGEGGFYYEPNQ